MKPVIGITTHFVEEASDDRKPRLYFRLNEQYVRAVRDAGGIPLLVPAHAAVAVTPQEALQPLQGLLMSGGSGLTRSFFKTNTEPTLRSTDPERYDYEVELVTEALHRQIPLMGICRGHQTIVEALGGSLCNSIQQDRPEAFDHYQKSSYWECSHHIVPVNGSLLAGHLGSGPVAVNSFHRQAVARLPDGLRPSAHSDDGLIEAYESNRDFILGVQFHPEWLYPERREFLGFFEEFVKAAKG